jgi:nitrile hydratase
MNGVHDMGGMHGFGPIVREEHEPRFHAEWEAHVVAIEELLFEGPQPFTLDAFRHGIERMAPADYLRTPYYERWLASFELNLIECGVLTAAELDDRIARLRQHPGATFPRRADADLARKPDEERGVPPSQPPRARFAVGDEVITRHDQPAGHTRLPRYARGKRGVIERLHGAQTFPDTNAHGLGKQPQPLYSVRFEARELWGDSAEPRQTVSLDLWQSYLEPASL